MSEYIVWCFKKEAQKFKRKRRKALMRSAIMEGVIVVASGMLLGHLIRLYVG